MATNELFTSCKIGDLEKVKYLVEDEQMELNIRDTWDSTPLYYACLCGHNQLVEYLLEQGAKCEESTFDGERCLYAALNDNIKKTLRSFKAITAKTMRRDRYEEFLKKLLDGDSYQDVQFECHGQIFKAHRCILSVRCQVLAELLATRWKNKNTISLRHRLMDPISFGLLLVYIYTGRMEVTVDNLPDIIRLAQHCELTDLVQELEANQQKAESFTSSKPGVKISTLSIESKYSRSQVSDQFQTLVDHGLPSVFNPMNELPFGPSLTQSYADICFQVEGFRFFGHKAFFCCRSDYFKSLLMNHFGEVQGDSMPVVTLQNIRPQVFVPVMNYLYTEQCQLHSSTVYEVLVAADLYLLSGLRRICGIFIGSGLTSDNVINILQISRMFTLPRLEDQCAEFIAQNLEVMIDNNTFHEQVLADAHEVVQREETDSLGIIDEVRYYITTHVQAFSEMEEAKEKLRLIDDFLETLGLDG